jgi:hypothetical protein
VVRLFIWLAQQQLRIVGKTSKLESTYQLIFSYNLKEAVGPPVLTSFHQSCFDLVTLSITSGSISPPMWVWLRGAVAEVKRCSDKEPQL